MDPNACVDLILTNIRAGYWEAAADSAEDLYEWARRGGFSPEPIKLDALQVAVERLPADSPTSIGRLVRYAVRICQHYP